MSKQQTPLQKAMEQIEIHEKTEFKNWEIVDLLSSLLPEEKKFAEDTFQAGRDYTDLLLSEGNGWTPNNKDAVEFTDFYKQYEDE